eukprot:757439-Hanusia_phi.AAC.4
MRAWRHKCGCSKRADSMYLQAAMRDEEKYEASMRREETKGGRGSREGGGDFVQSCVHLNLGQAADEFQREERSSEQG